MERYRILPHANGIQIVIPHEFTRLLRVITPSSHIVKRDAQKTRSIYIDDDVRWGLNGVLTRSETPECRAFIVPLLDCIHQELVTRSLHLLVLALNRDETRLKNPDPHEPLITLDGLLSGRGDSAHDMGATLSGAMLKALRKFRRGDCARVEEAMASFCAKFTRQGYPFQCSTQQNFSLTVPGDETYLICTDIDNGRLGGHNIDTFWQQAAILVGLAEVQAIAEQKITSS